jgi:hypothetical protein
MRVPDLAHRNGLIKGRDRSDSKADEGMPRPRPILTAAASEHSSPTSHSPAGSIAQSLRPRSHRARRVASPTPGISARIGSIPLITTDSPRNAPASLASDRSCARLHYGRVSTARSLIIRPMDAKEPSDRTRGGLSSVPSRMVLRITPARSLGRKLLRRHEPGETKPWRPIGKPRWLSDPRWRRKRSQRGRPAPPDRDNEPTKP